MSGTGLRHSAFVYESDADFVETMAPFISAGLDEGSPVVAVTTRGNCARLSSELGPAAKDVSFIDRDSWYVRPARTIAAYEARLRDLVQGGAEAIRVVGEVQFGPTHVEWDDWTAYEAVSNLAFAEYPARIVCPYDARALPDKVLEDAWRTHPGILGEDEHDHSRHEPPEDLVRGLRPRPSIPMDLQDLPVGADPMTCRERLAAKMASDEVPGARSLDMLVAASEVLSNAFTHAGGPEAIRAGLVGGRFVCEIEDGGPGLDDPLAGYLPPREGNGRGTGLWLARQLTSRLDLVSSTGGLTVRLWA
jgi:anti-sigma regulatory factor (Ser/Thr protein kinase)